MHRELQLKVLKRRMSSATIMKKRKKVAFVNPPGRLMEDPASGSDGSDDGGGRNLPRGGTLKARIKHKVLLNTSNSNDHDVEVKEGGTLIGQAQPPPPASAAASNTYGSVMNGASANSRHSTTSGGEEKVDQMRKVGASPSVAASRRRESLLVAASALASLGSSSPPSVATTPSTTTTSNGNQKLRDYRVVAVPYNQESPDPQLYYYHPNPPTPPTLNLLPTASGITGTTTTAAATKKSATCINTKQMLRQLMQSRSESNGVREPPSSSSSSWEILPSSNSWELASSRHQQHQQQHHHRGVVSTSTTNIPNPLTNDGNARNTGGTTMAATTTTTTLTSSARSNHHVSLTFPQKLMKILSNSSLSEIITWLPHGKGFILLQKKRFAEEVLPLCFKQSKFASFTRKLNRWGFVRVTRGPEMGAYYHKFFTRGNYLLCTHMTCQSTNATPNNKKGLSSSSAPSSSSTSPPSSPKEEKNVDEAASDDEAADADATTAKKNEGDGEEDGRNTPSSPSSHASTSSTTSSSSSTKSPKSKSSSPVVAAVKSASSKVEPPSPVKLPSLDLSRNDQQPTQQAREGGRGEGGRHSPMELRRALQSTITGPYLPPQDHHPIHPTKSVGGDHDHLPMMHDANGGRRNSGSEGRGHHADTPYVDAQYSRQLEILNGAGSGATGQHHHPMTNQRESLLNMALQQLQQQQQRSNAQDYSHHWSTSHQSNQPTITDQQHLFILQNLLGINTSTSRNHQQIMAKALDALKSSNDMEMMLKEASSYNSMVQQSRQLEQQQQQYTMNPLSSPSRLRQFRNSPTTNSIDDEIRAVTIQARRLHQQLVGGGGNTNTAASRNQVYAMADAMRNSSALELSSLSNDHPTMALLASIMATQDQRLANHPPLHPLHQAADRNIGRENATVNEEDILRNMTPVAHYMQQRRLRAKAEARLRQVSEQCRSSGQREMKRLRLENDPAGTSSTPPSSVSVRAGGERRQEAQAPTRRPLPKDNSMASLLANELEAKKHSRQQPSAPNVVKPKPGPVRRASASAA